MAGRPPKNEQKPPEFDIGSLKANLSRANDGDQQALAWLRRYLDEHPGIWGHLGDLVKLTETAWIILIAGDSALRKESISLQLKKLKNDLVGGSPGPVEKMLAEQVTSTWLESKYLEEMSAKHSGMTNGQSAMLLKRLDSAQRRHQYALRSLVQTRKLLGQSDQPPVLRIFPDQRATG